MTEQYLYLVDTGTVSADTADIKSSVEAEYKLALGSSLDTASNTAQGTLIAGETIARTSVMKNNAELANMTNPNLAYGTFLDAICSLLGIGRGEDQSTVATGVKITGTYLTFIPSGSRVSTSDEQVFETVGDITIPISGITTATIKSQNYGAIILPIGLLTIVDGTLGWGTAEIVVGTTITEGTLALLDPQLKNKRNQQLAIQGTGFSAAIKAAALSVANVTSAQVVENNTGATGLVNGVTFTQPRAVWVCVAGVPDQSQLAQALYIAHGGGCPWDFGTTGNGTPVNAPNGVSTIDASTGLTYNVKWTTPILHDCYVHVIVQQASSVSSPIPAVQAAMVNYASGQEAGELGFVIGANVSAFELAGAISRQLPGIYVKSCMVALVAAGGLAPVYPTDYSLEVVLGQFDQAQLQTGNITVVPV